ncbi:preprotein translocase subunit SecA [Chitinispirillales bacterium ANBcel5]|uniref:preprotein translocase subunit SecA n=1 Tax=Cellulosispirillum alkaliphilum TaxID=3039283 RepID=UPI002A545E4A|nr:preprotein translocase subunit SecA [Chitinispirillales bacterium ANBcel5]
MDLLSILGKVFGSKQEKDIRKLRPILEQVNSFKDEVKKLNDEQLKNKTAEFRERLAKGETLDDLLPEAYAVVRESTHRVLGEGRMVYDPYLEREIPFMAHFDVQVLGAIVLHQGKIAEMKTGEGKTQVAAMAAYLNALSGKGVHVITVNDYLARRDSEWMGKIFNFLGLTVGCLDDTEPHSPERKAVYACDITYGTNNEFGFDYLRDNMATSPDHCVLRELNFAIVDEVDNILIDEARTPLIISGPATKSNQEYEELKPRVTKLVSAQNQFVQRIIAEAEELLKKEGKEYEAGFKLLIAKRGGPKNKRFLKLIKEPGVAKHMKTVETDYLREKKLNEIDEELFYTIDESGHSAELTEKGRALVGGENSDFFVVPDLSVLLGKIDSDEALSPEEKSMQRDEAHRVYAERSERIHSISQLLKAYSLFERDVNYVVQEGQILIVDEFTGRILHGRRYSEGLHQALEAKEGVKVAGENQTLATITFQNFFKMYNKISGMTGTAVTEAGEFHEIYKLDVVTVPTNRPLKRVDSNDEIYKTHREKYNAIVKEIEGKVEEGRPCLVGTTSIEKSELISKLLTRAGVKHEVLNAKYHAKEATIVAQAGHVGAVTIATNMAGRGTDIVLGGNFEVMANNELIKQGVEPDELSLDEKRKKFEKLYQKTKEEHKSVLELGGLHIIGTERHESRRIDNQLRGRAGRQGDPGSTKFFLSLDDDLMRIFGSERIAAIMDKLGTDDGEVISHPLVSKAIGNAQKRVEGRNFDIRKHLKEYDDVMNLQRTEIYSLRQRILRGENLKDDILDQVAAALEEIIFKHTAAGKFPEEWDLSNLYSDIQTSFGIVYRIDEQELSNKTQDSLFDDVWKLVKERYEEKEARFGEELMRKFERSVFLMVIDSLWKDHLYEMDHLKGGVQFRAFGQKNPLFEYQREGLKMFEELRSTIAHEVSSYIFRLEKVERQQRAPLSNSKEIHGDVDLFSPQGPAAQPRPQQQPNRQLVTNRAGGGSGKPAPVRAAVQVGRNEPCPCGSGKKYKKCCGVQ